MRQCIAAATLLRNTGMLRQCIAAALAAVHIVAAANPATDEVTALPGWSDPFRSPRYSGYLAGADATRHISYYFVTSESSSPAEDPVVLWLNGGPGCSSLIGAWLEQGPLQMNADGSLSENDGRWNLRANMLFLESPPGVGFSYVDSGAAPLPYNANDTSTTADSLAALADFFAAYPAFASSPLWLTGESYAGIYVPWLAQAVLASSHAKLKASLQGILVGNGALMTSDVYEGNLVQQRMQHAHNHGLFSAALRAQIDAACVNWTAPRAPACDALLAQQQQEMGPLNAYNIEVTCASGSAQGRALLRSAGGGLPDATALAVTDDPCSAADVALTAYLNTPAVQQALHVTAGPIVLGAWSECAGADLRYTRLPVNESATVYPELLAANVSVLIYNGDQDEVIPYLQDELWTARMGFAVASAWRPWLVADQVAGYVTEFAVPSGARFTFATVKRAGHEVPMYQPARAQAMLQRYLARQLL